MRIDRRLTFIGVMLVVLSMTMATQYATTKVGYSYSIVHPSESDIRFIGSDNGSGGRILRVDGTNASGDQDVIIALGNWMPGSIKNYTAAFGIVNEELMQVNITHINVSGTGANYFNIWLHGDRSADVSTDATTAVQVVSAGTALYNSSHEVWKLGAGDGVTSTMNASSEDIYLTWDADAHVMYSTNDTDATNGTSDFVWVQVSLDIPAGASASSYSGYIWVHFRASPP
jgi:hypothetical protein